MIALMPVTSNVYFGEATTETSFNMYSTDPSLDLAFIQTLDRGFLLDGEPYMNNMTHANGTYDLPANVEFNLPFAFGFCQFYPPGFHPQSIYWDPQLSVLFSVQPPQTPANAKASRTWLAILLGTLFGALALILIVILVFCFVPAAQKVFTPFRNTSGSHQSEKAVSSRWNATVKQEVRTKPGAAEMDDVKDD